VEIGDIVLQCARNCMLHTCLLCFSRRSSTPLTLSRNKDSRSYLICWVLQHFKVWFTTKQRDIRMFRLSMLAKRQLLVQAQVHRELFFLILFKTLSRHKKREKHNIAMREPKYSHFTVLGKNMSLCTQIFETKRISTSTNPLTQCTTCALTYLQQNNFPKQIISTYFIHIHLSYSYLFANNIFTPLPKITSTYVGV